MEPSARHGRRGRESSREAAGLAVFGAVETLARMARAVDAAGQPAPVPERYRARAAAALLRHGLATDEELETLPLEALLERLGERLRRRWGHPSSG